MSVISLQSFQKLGIEPCDGMWDVATMPLLFHAFSAKLTVRLSWWLLSFQSFQSFHCQSERFSLSPQLQLSCTCRVCKIRGKTQEDEEACYGLLDRLEVKLPTIWTDGKAEVGRVREEKRREEERRGEKRRGEERREEERRGEKRRREKIREETVRRQKNAREKGREVAICCALPMIYRPRVEK